MTDPNWEPVMKTRRCLVTKPRRAHPAHAAIIAANWASPLSSAAATPRTSEGRHAVTVSCAGETPASYLDGGLLETEVTKSRGWGEMPDIISKVMMNVGNSAVGCDFAQTANHVSVWRGSNSS